MCSKWVVLFFWIILVGVVSGVEFVLRVGDGEQTDSDFELQSDGSEQRPYWKNSRLWLTPEPTTTASSQSQMASLVGRVLYKPSLPLFHQANRQVASFNTSFQFQIVKTVNASGDSGDGLAFFISPSQNVPANSTAMNLGLITLDSSNNTDQAGNQLFAVGFDTNNSTLAPDPASLDGYLYNAWVQYSAPVHHIQVWAAKDTKQPSQPCLSAFHDLSAIFNRSEQSLYVGISASTGKSAQGNTLLSWNFSSEDVISPHQSHSHPGVLVLALAFSSSGAVLLAVACGLAALFFTRRKQKHLNTRPPRMIDMMPPNGVPRHSYKELRKATKQFSDQEKVGEGGFSSVYKGTLSTGKVVAVKRLKEGLRMEAEFASEIQIISQIRHRNLLQLQGWCYEKGEALLVYEFMPNGSLDAYLFGKKKEELMDGEKRFNILLGVAAALEYLHGGLGACVLHRDVKAANVILTERFEPLLGDFGLARLITHDQVVTLTAAGTPGYVAPEVAYTGRATDKADVYSFGVLALEVACGRRALDMSFPSQEIRLVDRVWLLQQSSMLIDALGFPLQSNLQALQWQCVLHVALLCCQPSTEARPTMREVHQALREKVVLPVPSTRPMYGINNNNPANVSMPNSSSSSCTPPGSENVVSIINPSYSSLAHDGR